ncbi:FAD-binding oxidoreductase [Frigidibacter sp. MR17.14]|uniref:NAD(P)/FAD-dependent oxidoreductase n=1 Tax=Frigidibacter sp. MR17.14 TaxID=3126509 RepID=UPI003012AA70
MKRLHAPPAYDPAFPASHWARSVALTADAPLAGAARCEVAVIGAGYAGLNAALALARDHGRGVRVLEAAETGWGASGRNGGFCCIGGAKLSGAQVAARVGAAGAADWARWQRAAIDHVAGLIDAAGIPARQGPEGEVLLAHSPRAWNAFVAEGEGELVPRAALAERGLAGPAFFGAKITPEGFPLDPMTYLQGLARLARAADVVLHGQSPVTGLAPCRDGWRLTTPGGALVAGQVLIATNGYSSEDLPGWMAGRYMPAFSAVMVTRPLSGPERRAQGFTTPLMSYDSRVLLHYFRHLPDGRFLFGMRGGLSARAVPEARTHARVARHFATLFPAWAGVEVESRWSGLVCLTGSLAPYVGPVPGAEGLYAAFGWHGNGVAAGSYGGLQAARLMAGAASDRPALIAAPPARLPGPGRLRRAGLAASYLGYALKDGPLPARG